MNLPKMCCEITKILSIHKQREITKGKQGTQEEKIEQKDREREFIDIEWLLTLCLVGYYRSYSVSFSHSTVWFIIMLFGEIGYSWFILQNHRMIIQGYPLRMAIRWTQGIASYILYPKYPQPFYQFLD